jgi:uncharacterized protein with GYD domain
VRTFILLSTLSPQGVETLVATPERLFEVNREIEALGGRVLRQWALLGHYDFLSVVEAPDEKVIARLTVEMASRGSARFDSLEALDVDDLREALHPPEPDGGAPDA